MEFDFDEIINRGNTGSIKWDSAQDASVLPMWVADMDFKTAPCVIQALQKRVSHGVFGYANTPEEFYTGIMAWWEQRHGLQLQENWIQPSPGVIPALSATLTALGNKGDKVLIQPPVYNHFYITLKNSGLGIVENTLVYEDGYYRIDFEDLEQKASDPAVTLMLISNPHNPVGRAWHLEELEKISAICVRHKVAVISDEIHADLVMPDVKHIPFASIAAAARDYSVTLSSPSKAFNLAGLQVGYLFTTNENFMQLIQKELANREMELLSPFATVALTAAYNNGGPWLDALRSYLFANYLYLKSHIENNLPQLKVVPLEATYLVWVDCSATGKPASDLAAELLQDYKLWVNDGAMYGDAGKNFLRINIACPRALLLEGLYRLSQAF